MRGIKSSLSVVFAIGLVVGSVAGVAAQAEADDAVSAAPVAVTATSAPGPCPSEGTIEDMGRFERSVGATCQPTWQWSDERLNGTVTWAANGDEYTDGSDLWLGTFALSIENDEGGWRMRPIAQVEFPDAPQVTTEAWIMDGEGAYEGLTAVLLVADYTPHGFIIEGGTPPAPENASTK